MLKPAVTAFPILEPIQNRWSPVGFDPRPFPSSWLGSLLEAARWAPSSYGDQPWSFCVATQDQPTEFAALLNCLMEANQVWARNAHALLLSCAHRTYSRNGQPNRHAWHDVGLATQSLLVQATALGLATHPMGGFSADQARETLGIPDDYDPVAMIAVGYPAANPEQMPADLQQRDAAPRSRKPLTDFVFSGRWGKFAGPFG